MSEKKVFIPYNVQKGNRPKIEEVVNFCLDGELRQSVLEFASWLSENDMPITLHSSTTRGYNAKYKGEYICHMLFTSVDDDRNWKNLCKYYPDGPYQFWSVAPVLTNMDKYREKIINESLQLKYGNVIYWCTHGSHGSGTGKCDPQKPCAGGRDMSVFCDGYDGICMSLWPAVKNPDDALIKTIKRLIELEKSER